MKSYKVLFLIIVLSCSCTRSYVIRDFNQNRTTSHDNSSVRIIDRYSTVDGFYIFYDSKYSPNKYRPIIYFFHGMGALNPGIYGKWIKHLIDQSAIVVFPRYQMTLMSPRPNKYEKTIPASFHNSYNYLNDSLNLRIDHDDLHFIGHSYGGAAINYLLVNMDSLHIPKPRSSMACHPGTGPFSGMELEDYGAIPEDVKLVVVSAEKDDVVGDKMAERIFKTAVRTTNRVWIKHYNDGEGDNELKADHRSSYAIDTLFDNHIMNSTARRAWNKSKYDAEDLQGFFKINDELRTINSGNFLFNPDNHEWNMGLRENGDTIRPFELVHPKS